MTQIPEHLLRRAEEARAAAQKGPNYWGLNPMLARVIVYLYDEHSTAKPVPEDVLDCVRAARSEVQRSDEIRQASLRNLLRRYEAEYGEITPEEIADIRRSMHGD
jgi:hypothetical protein